MTDNKKLSNTERRNNLLNNVLNMAKPHTDKMTKDEKERLLKRFVDLGKPPERK